MRRDGRPSPGGRRAHFDPATAIPAESSPSIPSRPGDAISVAEQITALWRMLAACPPAAVRWAGIGWTVAHLERDLDAEWELELAGREAAALARPIWKAPTYAELRRRRGEQ